MIATTTMFEPLCALAPFFCRTFGALAVLPINLGFSGLMLRFSLSAGGALFMAGHLPVSGGSSAAGLLVEVAMGALLALPALLVLSAAAMLGELFDITRGQNVAELYDPVNGKAASFCADFLERYATLLLLSAGLLDRLLAVLLKSFTIIAPGGYWPPGAGFTQRVLEFIPYLLGQFCAFFLPVLLVFCLVDLVFGYLGKLLPQAALQTEFMLAKSVCGFCALVYLSRQEVFLGLMDLANPRIELLGV